MAVSAKWFGQALMQALGSGSAANTPNIDYLSDSIKVVLASSAATPNQDTWVFYEAVTDELPSASGYTAGGVALSAKAITYTASTNVIALDADDVSWTAATIQARYAFIYDDTPATAATKPLLSYVDFGETISSTNGTFQITWNAGGIQTITPA